MRFINLCQYHDLISEHTVKSIVKVTVFCDVGRGYNLAERNNVSQ